MKFFIQWNRNRKEIMFSLNTAAIWKLGLLFSWICSIWLYILFLHLLLFSWISLNLLYSYINLVEEWIIHYWIILNSQVLHLDWRPLTRDATFYGLSICVFIVFAWDGRFYLWESCILLLLYFLYIVIMKFNPKLMEKMAQCG